MSSPLMQQHVKANTGREVSNPITMRVTLEWTTPRMIATRPVSRWSATKSFETLSTRGQCQQR
jgi:hypothetical protein